MAKKAKKPAKKPVMMHEMPGGMMMSGEMKGMPAKAMPPKGKKTKKGC